LSGAGPFLEALQEELGGSIPFEDFMRAALYHPEFGYYTTSVRGLGKRGDFSTWSAFDGNLSRAIASWLAKSPHRHTIEVGAGDGTLSLGILKASGWLARARRIHHIVEISPRLRDLQRKTLRGWHVAWHERLEDALAAAGGKADIFSNELADAFPCRVFVRSGGGWRELAIHVSGGSAREVLIDRPLPDSTAFLPEAPEGTRVEVHESYHTWLADWAPLWKGGRRLTIDYGGTMPELYSRRPQGSLRAYAFHQRLVGADVFSAFGKRDITADVNFSDLRKWGHALGWEGGEPVSLGRFLSAHTPGCRLSPALQEAAEAFQTLIQSPP